jgi:hypothetical protein
MYRIHEEFNPDITMAQEIRAFANGNRKDIVFDLVLYGDCLKGGVTLHYPIYMPIASPIIIETCLGYKNESIEGYWKDDLGYQWKEIKKITKSCVISIVVLDTTKCHIYISDL